MMKIQLTRHVSAALLTLLAAMTLAGCDNNKSVGTQSKVLRVGTTGQSFPGSYKENGTLVG